ncbi:MAG: hypothetical protein ACXV8R_18210, partial [Acidimicrobiia bacterium]
MSTFNSDAELQARAQEKVEALSEYERRHPYQRPDRDGRPYDPVGDVIDGWRSAWVAGDRREIDEVRT